MQVSAATLIFFGLLAACANLAGGLLVLPVGGALKRREVLLKFLVGAGADFYRDFAAHNRAVANRANDSRRQKRSFNFPDAFVARRIFVD
jgi:hypothetical protein